MVTSGTYTWAPSVADLTDQAFGQCGIEPSKITHQHLKAATRSLNFVFRDIENAGYRARSYAVDRQSQVLTVGERGFQLPAGTIDVLDAVYVLDGVEQPLTKTDLFDYERMTGKTDQGRPALYFVSREIPAELSYIGGTPADTWTPGGQTGADYQDRPILVHWPAAQSAGTLVYHRVRFIQDASVLGDDVDVHRAWHLAVSCGFAWHLALTYAPARAAMLEGLYERKKKDAAEAESSTGDLMVYGRWNRRRRRN